MKAVLSFINNPKPIKVPEQQSNMMTLIVHSKSNHQAELCPIAVLRSFCKRNSGQLEEGRSVPFVNGGSGSEVRLEMKITVGMVRSNIHVWMRSHTLSEQFCLNKLGLHTSALLRKVLKNTFLKALRRYR